MKYIVFSFDDGRKDFFVNALPILKKYKLTATLNVIPDFLDAAENSDDSLEYASSMTWDDTKACLDNNIEIANHSANHTNEVADIVRGSDSIKEHLGLSEIGFSSPNSDICSGNYDTFSNLTQTGKASYIRSGNQLRRDGLIYALLYIIYKYTKSAFVFSLYNKRNIIKSGKPSDIYPSVTCNCDNTVNQLIKFIKNMPDNSAAIIMFHSILEEHNPGYGNTKWSNTTEEFEKICSILSSDNFVKIITNSDLHNLLKKGAV